MNQIERKKINFEDDRGQIIDILENEKIEYVTVITSNKGAVRGNHFHKESLQITYLLEGRLAAFTKPNDGEVKVHIMQPMDLVRSLPMEIHAFIALERSKFLVFTRGPRGGNNYENDTFRVETLFPTIQSYIKSGKI